MRVLVTGSSGLVGSAVVSRLRQAAHDVTPFDLDIGLDVRSDADVAAAIEEVDAVVHLAAVLGWHGESDEDFMHVNLTGTWRVLSHAVRVRCSEIRLCEQHRRPRSVPRPACAGLPAPR